MKKQIKKLAEQPKLNKFKSFQLENMKAIKGGIIVTTDVLMF